MPINSSTKQLRAFVTVGRLKSFTAAAERLFVTQSTITSSLKNFEDDIGVKLFDRTTRKVALTSAGEAFMPVANRLLEEFDGAMSDLKLFGAGHSGKVRVATTSSAMMRILAPSLPQFTRTHPNVHLSIRDGVSSDTRRLVSAGEVDFGIGTLSGSDPTLKFTPLLADRMGVVCRPGHHLLETARTLTWQDLEPYPYVRLLMDSGMSSMIEELPVFRRERGTVTHEVSAAGLLDSLLAGQNSFSIVSSLVAGLPAMKNLEFRPLEEPILERQLGLLQRKDREPSAFTENFIQCIHRTLQQCDFPVGVRLL